MIRAEASLACSLALPPGFRAADVLAYHRRDPQQLAERVTPDTLEKGIAWSGHAACLGIRFSPGHAHATLAFAGRPNADDHDGFARVVRRMLGLTQDVAGFEAAHAAHPLLGPLIAARPGLRVPLAATPFEALTWAITGQQISLGAALTLRRNLVRAAGLVHPGGLACYPDADRLAALPEATLREAGFSGAKAKAIRLVAAEAAGGRLPLDAWAGSLDAAAVRAHLLALRGIGPWTVDYTLLRGFGWLDGSLHGDAAVRRGLQAVLGSGERIGEKAAMRWLEDFSPWRALVAAHLWVVAAQPAP